MEKKLTVGQCLAIYKQCNALQGKSLPGLLGYKLSRAQKAVEPAVKAFDEQRRIALSSCESEENVQKSLLELLEEEEELKIPHIPLKLLEKADLPISFFNAFDTLIEEDPE